MTTSQPALAFLQNMWVRDPERARQSIARWGEEFRLQLIRRSLFAGCKTGRVIKTIFGEAIVSKIIFEESTREISSDSREIFPAQPEHIRAAIELHKPKVIITFGKIASNAVFGVMQELTFAKLNPFDIKFISAPHPAAIGEKITKRLIAAAKELSIALQ